MNLNYSQTTGNIMDDDGNIIARGWSGNHAGKNNPSMENVPCIGPLPRGIYEVCPWEEWHGHLGPMVAFLKPSTDNTMFGRGDFFIHGPSRGESYGEESKGCIVLVRPAREKVKAMNPTTITVIA